MDIITHAMMGYVLAAPILPTAPLTGGCLILGSVLPDLDAISRCFGRRAFLRWHQTYTHGVPAILFAGVMAWLLIPRDLGEPWAPVALIAGLLLHVALDLTNTYGTAIFSPLSMRRYCTEWVFFIDSVAVVAGGTAILLQWLLPSRWAAVVAIAYAVLLATYWIARFALRRRASRYAPPNTLSLIPSSLVPWRYFGCAESDCGIRAFRISALAGSVDRQEDVHVHDKEYAYALNAVPEFKIMRQLSPAYRITEATPVANGIRLTCRDLRTRNFGGRFGELIAVVTADGRIIERRFNV